MNASRLKILRLIFLVLCLLVLSTLSPVISKELDRIVVIVNDDIITQQELDAQLALIIKQIREKNTLLPPTNVLRKQVLEREIIKQIQLQLANNTGLLVDDNALNNTIDKISSQNNLTVREFRDVLEQDGYPFARFRDDIRNEMIIARLRQREVHNRITVSEQEINNFLATQSAQGNVDDEFRIAHILISLPEAASAKQIAEAKNKAQGVLQQLQEGTDFKQTAISVSDGQQALEGGDLGWRKAGQLPTLFSQQVTIMNVGELSDTIRSASGFHIIKLVEKKAGETHLVTQTKARHILIKPSDLTSKEEVIKRLKQLKERIESGDDFGELAKTHSEDRGSAVNGGDLGWTNPGDMVPQFEAEMEKLANHQISDPFQTQFGWHIVQALERREQDNSEAYTRSKSRETLRQRKINEVEETWLRQLRDEAYVEYKIDL